MSETKKFAPGDTVIVTSVNRGKPREATVSKVGRTLVYIDSEWGRGADAYRIDSGRRNDNYGHEHVWTLFEWAAKEARQEAERRVKGHGLRFDYDKSRKFATANLNALADLLDSFSPATTHRPETTTDAREANPNG